MQLSLGSTGRANRLYLPAVSRLSGFSCLFRAWLALLPLVSGCQSNPFTDVFVSSESSLLAVDVAFPARMSRDPSLVQVFFVRGPIHAGLDELPELVPATFVKWSRAYLLDPEPGTYSVVAVTSAFAPPWNDYPIAGVSQTRYSGTSADATIFPAELIQRTRSTVAPGRVTFMGVLRVRPGERINADAVLQDDLQRRIAERIRPGTTAESGLAGWLKRTRMVDLEETSFSDGPGDRASFFEAALEDLGDSPWATVVTRAAPHEADAPTARAPSRQRERIAPIPEIDPPPAQPAPLPPSIAPLESSTVPPEANTVTREPSTVTREPNIASTEPNLPPAEPASVFPELEVASREPSPPAPIPERHRFPGVPDDSALDGVELGMSHHEVRELLGPPDDRIDRSTGKAWIPFYTGPGAYLRDWIYDGEGRVVFSRHDSSLVVLDVVYDPSAGK